MPEIITPQILPHPKRGTMEIGTERIMPVFGNVRAAEGASTDRPIVTIQGTDGSEDRHGTPIEPDGWDFKPYMLNPIVLWQHGEEKNLPAVGRTLEIRRAGGAWDFDIELAIVPWRHLRDNIPAFLWDWFSVFGGPLASSVSFIPKEWEDYVAKQMPSFFAEGVRYKKQELTEISFVNVPSNRNSVVQAIEHARSTGRFTDSLARMLGYEVSPLILNSSRANNMTKKREAVRAFRSTLQSVITRCCGCEPYREPKPESITEEQKAAELAIMTELANSLLAVMDASMRGWRATIQSMQRNIYANGVVDSMYRIEGLVWRAKEWFGADLEIDVPALDAVELEQVGAGANGDALGRAFATARRGAIHADVRAATRTKIAEILRCCGCPSYEEQIPDLPTDEASRLAEQQILRTIADESLMILETGISGWKTAKNERLREMCRSRSFDSMWAFDTCVRYLDKWYEVELDIAPAADTAELARMFDGFDAVQTRAGAVFSKKNLDKIDQVLALMTELRAAATKPAADDVPDEERRRAAMLALVRADPPFDFASTQVNLEGENADAVLSLAATIPDEALAEKGRETTPHVTVCFGIDPATDAATLADAIADSDAVKEMAARGGATMTLGATAIFTSEPGSHADGADVVYVSVDSPDLETLNALIKESATVTSTQSEYVPHVTLAYVTQGEGEKYSGDETLAGTVVTFDALQFSDTEGNLTEISLAGAPAADVPAESRSIKIRIKDSGVPRNEPRGKSQTFRVLVPDAPRGRSGDDPSKARPTVYELLLK